MKKLFLITFLYASLMSYADEGDTIVVQTIDFSTPVNPGWNAPREGYYVFPPDTLSFSKILMYHRLKCDPTQNPPCGEWDYTTHTNLWHHTGLYDSNMYYHPNFMVYGASPDSFMYMDEVSWKYRSWLEYSNLTTPLLSAGIGTGSTISSLNDPAGSSDGRLQYLYKADELMNSGFTAGEITGLQFSVNTPGGILEKFTVRLALTELDNIHPGEIIDIGLLKVYEKDISFDAIGWMSFPFSFPFYWDGSSNLIIDISYEGDENTASIDLDASDVTFPSSLASHDENNCLYFHQGDFVEVPVDGVMTLDSAITISFWAYGNWMQPVNNSALEAINEEGQRVINVHLPWSNGNVYWDCGSDGNYDRIFKSVSPDEYKGRWTHWAFTKDVSTGIMKIYKNGIPFHIGGSKSKLMTGITEFKIGSNGAGTNNYEGMLDEIRIFNSALEQETIASWMRRDLDASHPAYANLIAYFNFDEGNGFETSDNSAYAVTAHNYGYPEWLNYHGKNRQMNFVQQNSRPVIMLESGIYDPLELDSIVRVDTLPNNQVMIVMYEDLSNPTLPTDTLSPWPHYYDNIVFDAGGIATDSSLVPPDHILYKIESPYYVQYEILDKYELGRFITPYGNNLSLGDDGFTWVYDVSDFRQFLADTVHLSAGNFQELLDLEFHMIEGIPPRDVINIDRLWHGYWSLTNFNEQTLPYTVHPDATAEMFRVKVTTSGHEFDNATNCAEFCQKTHFVDVDSITRYEWEIIDECADNPLYPQGGTWIYDRAGWCPGAKVTQRNWELTPFINPDSVLLDYNCDYDPYGKYSVAAYFVSYSSPNFTLDAAVDEVISPNDKKRYGRFNPMCSRPEIIIQNTGADTLYNLDIHYGPETAATQTFHWEGSLAFLEKETVVLDPIDWTGWQNGNNTFHVNIENPNGGQDQYQYNNTFKSRFELSPEYPESFVIKFRTNKVGYQNYYEILDYMGNVVFMKDDFENETTYEDTVNLQQGCYTFILHDSGDNGISFWANSQGSGYIFFKDLDGGNLYYFNPDFGKFTRKDFTVGLAVDIVDLTKEEFMEVYPNPSNGILHINYSFGEIKDLDLRIYDARGTAIYHEMIHRSDHGNHEVNLTGQPAGLYFCTIRKGNEQIVKKIVLR